MLINNFIKLIIWMHERWKRIVVGIAVFKGWKGIDIRSKTPPIKCPIQCALPMNQQNAGAEAEK